jgi:hypothetical protein
MQKGILSTPVKLALIVAPVPQLYATRITSFDSTQPRGASAATNDLGQDISPLIDGLMSPHQRLEYIYPIWDDHYTWSGMMMANSMCDPSFMAMLNIVNKTFIRYVNAHDGDPSDPDSDVAQRLDNLGLTRVFHPVA